MLSVLCQLKVGHIDVRPVTCFVCYRVKYSKKKKMESWKASQWEFLASVISCLGEGYECALV